MINSSDDCQPQIVLGQKYAYATISLILGIACFTNLAGLEKALLAVIFGWLALRNTPDPRLAERRAWAQAGMAMGVLMLVVVPTIIILNFDRLRVLLDALVKLSNGK